MILRLACIVEGHGERDAFPVVLRRIGQAIDSQIAVQVFHPIRIHRGLLVKPGELERVVELAGRRVGSDGVLFILLDSDDDLPCELGPSLLGRAKAVRSDLRISVVLAHREFESWFLAAAESLRGQRHLAADLTPPPDPEAVRGAKEWLAARMEGRYAETVDQPALAALFDLEAARRAPSFDRLYRKVEALLTAPSE